MFKMLLQLWRDRSGATAIEYAFIIGLVGITLIISLNALADSTSNLFRFISSSVDSSM